MQHSTKTSICSLISRLEDRAGCDPEFDTTYEELEREFAERRLQFDSEA